MNHHVRRRGQGIGPALGHGEGKVGCEGVEDLAGVREVGDYGVDVWDGWGGVADVEVEDGVAEAGEVGNEVGAGEAGTACEDDAFGGGHGW